MTQALISTYSMWSLFRNCRKACEYRYVLNLVPQHKDPNQSFGSAIHEFLQLWHETRDLIRVLDRVDQSYASHTSDSNAYREWHLARAMMTGYAARYPQEDFEVVYLEKTFEGLIINPATGAPSRRFLLAGKVDGIVRIGRDYYIVEHKTAATIDADYLERLWTDFQIAIYSYYIEKTLGIPITGVLYNVLAKARLQQGSGETEEEFQARRAELIAKSKTGKSTAKRKLPESDADFQGRLAAKYSEPEMFHREMLYLSRDRFDILRAELWELTQAFLDAKRRNVFYQNTAFCFHHNRPCTYFPICRSNGNPNVIENFYTIAEPHEELRAPAANEPVF